MISQVLIHDRTDSRPGFRQALSDEDVRKRLDRAVRRGWAELGRRVARVGFILAEDVGLAVLVLGTLGHGALWSLAPAVVPPMPVEVLVGTVVLLPFSLAVMGCYGSGGDRTRSSRIAFAIVLALAVVWTQGRLGGATTEGVPWLAAAVALYPALLAGRWMLDRAITLAYRTGLGSRRLFIVGAEAEAAELTALLRGTQTRDLRLLGRVAPGYAQEAGTLGTLGQLEELIRCFRADGVLIASSLTFEALESLARLCFELGVSVAVMPRALHRLGRLELRTTRAGSIIQLQPRGMRLPQLALKRGIDLVLCSVALFLLWPLFAAIAIAIKLDSEGPVLFRQERAGVGGRPFRMFKFRTMRVDADRMKIQLAHLNESGDPRLFKIRLDPRVTRVGRFLRRSSLDELPQLLNVLRGEMSLVGPRPFFPGDLEAYEDHHFERLFVLPGITGLWQVSGRSEVVDFDEVVRLDSEYIRNWSVGLDLSIILRTVPAAFGRGAY